MNLRVQPIVVFLAVLICSTTVFAQAVTTDAPFAVKTFANLQPATNPDGVINITNSGASGGNISVAVYGFSPDEQLISCCCCVVTPNALVSLSARRDVATNTLTPAVPSSIVVKLVSFTGACNASAPGALATGLLAWGTSIHALSTTPGGFALTEGRFAPATLSAAELARITSLCGFIQSNGSGFGICASCRLGGLGGSRQ